MRFQVNPDGEAVNLDALHGTPVDLDGCPETDTPDTQADPAVTGACPTDHIDEGLRERAWSAEQFAEFAGDHAPWSHAIGVLAAIAAIAAAAIISVVVAAATVTPAPRGAAPATTSTTTSTITSTTTDTSTSTDTSTDTVTITPTQTPTTTVSPTPYAGVVFNPALITAAQRGNFTADLARLDVATPPDKAFNIAVQSCLDLNGIRRSDGAVTTAELLREEQSWVHPGGISLYDSGQIISSAVLYLPNCY